MAPRFAPLRHYCIDASICERASLGHSGRRSHDDHVVPLDLVYCAARQRPKGEAEYRRARFETCGHLILEPRCRRCGAGRRRESQFLEPRPHGIDSSLDSVVVGLGRRLRSEEVDPERPGCSRTNRPAPLDDLFGGQVRGACRSKRASVAYGGNEFDRIPAAGHRRLDHRDGQFQQFG